jgi:hypothetical protein
MNEPTYSVTHRTCGQPHRPGTACPPAHRLPWTPPTVRTIPHVDGQVPDGELTILVWHAAGRAVILTADHGRVVADEPLPNDREQHEQHAEQMLDRLGITRHATVDTSETATVWSGRRTV